MTVAIYEVGQVATLTWSPTDVNGNFANPTTVTLKVRDPLGNVTTPTVTTSTTPPPTYTATVTLNSQGEWQYAWIGSGAANNNAYSSVINVVDRLVT